VKSHSETYQAKAVIVTVGASPIRLGVPGEEEFIGRGVSFCATCDGFFFRDKDVVVVGGGDSAMEEGIFLTRFANQVQVVHRRDQLRAGEALKRRAMNNEKIDFVWDSVVEEIVGNGKVEGIRLRNLKTGDRQQMPTDGVFIFIGHYPNSSLFEGQLKMDDKGYLIVDDKLTTSTPGVFAAGEIMDPVYRQIATSVGQGCSAAMMAERWLREHS
jgi:thioredoxin reductase (NADPH)